MKEAFIGMMRIRTTKTVMEVHYQLVAMEGTREYITVAGLLPTKPTCDFNGKCNSLVSLHIILIYILILYIILSSVLRYSDRTFL